MGLTIKCDDDATPPRPCRLVLTCDGARGMFEARHVFDGARRHIEQYATAMRAGWKETMPVAQRSERPSCSAARGCTSGPAVSGGPPGP